MPLVKWFLAIPHFIVLFFLGIASIFAVIVAWFAILFTGAIREASSNSSRASCVGGSESQAYALLLITDRYPPFTLAD